MTKPKLPVDIYTRVSRVGAREHLTSPDDQERQARAFAKVQALKVGEVLPPDLDESGGTLDRPSLQLALQRIEEGKSGGIIVAYLSRASRDTRQGLDLLEQITKAGGAVFAPNLPDYTTADGEMLTTIQLAIDTGYLKRKGEEFERAKAAAIENGVPVNSRPPVGYVKDPKTRRLVPDPVVAPIVREVFELRAQGKGPAAIGQFLQSRGVTTSQGSKTWSKPAVYGLLSNRVYLGELRYGNDDRYFNPAAHEPIVDLATWQAAQRPNGHRLTPTRSANPGLLSGILRCAGCRYCLQYTTDSHGRRIYRCTKTHAGGTCEAPARSRADAVEARAIEAFWSLTKDLEARGTADAGEDLAKLEAALERAERLLRQLEGADAQDALGDDYLRVYTERRKARDAAAEGLGKARAAAATTTSPVSTQRLSEAWERMTVQERRDLLALRIDTISLNREKQLLVYPAGTLNFELPKRGFRQAPTLQPFPAPPKEARKLGVGS